MKVHRLTVGAAVGALLACSRDVPRPAPASGSIGATVEAIVEKPAAYLSRTVTVSGEIERIHGRRAFTLGGGDFVLEKELLILTPTDFTNVADRPGGVGLKRDDIVQVTGEVRQLEIAEIERELNFDLTPELEVEFRSRPVIIARNMLTSPRKQPPTTPVGGGPDLALVDPIADIAILIDTPPNSVIGKNVVIDDAKVQSVVSDRGIWIGPSHRQQVFVETPQKAHFKLGDTVDIRGRVEAPPSSDKARKDLGVSPDVAQLIATEPNIVRAESVVKD